MVVINWCGGDKVPLEIKTTLKVSVPFLDGFNKQISKPIIITNIIKETEKNIFLFFIFLLKKPPKKQSG